MTERLQRCDRAGSTDMLADPAPLKRNLICAEAEGAIIMPPAVDP
ncbi:MAG: hypothetical protein ACRD1T_20120 [Acidimicrobiia bacterium]